VNSVVTVAALCNGFISLLLDAILYP
jgi:hypothetical protein